MNRPAPVLLVLESPPEEVLRKLEERFPLRVDETPASPRIYLDTFDGRLHAADRTLAFTAGRGAGTLELGSLVGELLRRTRVREIPAFAADLPRGPLADAVAPLIDVRRLLPVAELRSEGPRLRLLDDLEKTVVRIEVLTGTVAPPDGPRPWPGEVPGSALDTAPLPPLLMVRPVRGYDEAFAAAVATLERELGLPRAQRDLLTVVLGALGRDPRGYGSKWAPELDPEMPAEEAARRVHRALLETIRANEEGTRLDLDPEFLHDFRVAVRRTRSALTQVKGVFPEPEVERFKNELAWLGQATGPTRDLDVYLLKLPGYREGLGDLGGSHLDPLRRFLAEHREIEQTKMAKVLRSKRYRELLEEWEAFLDRETPPEPTAAPNARRPIREVVSARIWKLWRRVCQRGRRITPETEAADLHRLRIDCKKLRYLLELFGGLYPPDEIRLLVRRLKRLQDNLGDFNDYEVQQKRLEIFADRMVDEDLAPVPTLLAMGRLLEHMARGQEREHRRFEKRFGRFTSKGNRRRFRKLFQTASQVDGSGG
jgi:CHAD domain-containing protein